MNAAIPLDSLVTYTKTNSPAKVVAYDPSTDSYLIECCDQKGATINTIRDYLSTDATNDGANATAVPQDIAAIVSPQEWNAISNKINAEKAKLYDDFKIFTWWSFFTNNNNNVKYDDLPIVPDARTCQILIEEYFSSKPIGFKSFSSFLQSWLFSPTAASQDDWNTLLPTLILYKWQAFVYNNKTNTNNSLDYRSFFMDPTPSPTPFVFTKDPRHCFPILKQYVESPEVLHKIRSAYSTIRS
jgi:hypothetical protein